MTEPAQKLKGEVVRNSATEYHADTTRIGSTIAKEFLRSPLHAKYKIDHPPEPTPAMQLGTAMHLALLEPEKLNEFVFVLPQLDRRKKADKELWEQLQIEHAGKVFVTLEQHNIIKTMIDNVYSNEKSKRLLSNGHAEQSFYWRDTEGVDCKCRPDFIRDGHILIDIKTTTDASLPAFQKSIANFRYHFQAAWYLNGVSQVTGNNYDTFIIIAVETSPPHDVAVYALDDATIEKGHDLTRLAIESIARCQRSNTYPGYSKDIVPINLPPWAWKEFEE